MNPPDAPIPHQDFFATHSPVTDTFVQLFFSLGSGLIAIVRKLHSSGSENHFVKENAPCLKI